MRHSRNLLILLVFWGVRVAMPQTLEESFHMPITAKKKKKTKKKAKKAAKKTKRKAKKAKAKAKPAKKARRKKKRAKKVAAAPAM